MFRSVWNRTTLVWIHSVYTGPVLNWKGTVPHRVTYGTPNTSEVTSIFVDDQKFVVDNQKFVVDNQKFVVDNQKFVVDNRKFVVDNQKFVLSIRITKLQLQ